MVEFFVPGEPVPQPRPRVFLAGGRARAVSAPKAHPVTAFKEAVALTARQACEHGPLRGPLWLYVLFLMPRPKSKCWKRRSQPREWHHCKPDLDNLVKALLDGCNMICWHDDAQVCFMEVAKRIAAGHEQAGVAVKVVEAEE